MRYLWYDTLPQAAADIRKTVFIDEQGFQEEFDARDEAGRCRHLVVCDGDQAVATCRCFAGKEEGVWTIGRIAVVRARRGTGLGRVLMQEAEAECKRRGAKKAVVSAQVRASGFYRAIGYDSVGEAYLDEDCPHIRMEKEL